MNSTGQTQRDTLHVKIGRLWGERVPVDNLYRRRGDPDYTIRRIQNGKFVGIPDGLRNKAVYIIGKPGTGKSTLAEIMAIQDIRQGKGVAFIDPHGDHADDLLNYIPPERVPDVIFFEPRRYPVLLDLLDADNPDEINELASDIFNLFQRFSLGEMGPQMGTILKFALHTMIRARQRIPRITFMNLEDFLVSDNYREQCLRQPGQTERIKHFWREEYPKYKNKDSANAILRRMTDIRLSPVLPRIFGDEDIQTDDDHKLNIQEIMDERKILIVNLLDLTEDDRRILGTTLITKIQLVLPRRKERIPFYLYVDELDEFAASPFQKIITKCRKFNINLTLMNQGLYQIKQEDNKRAIRSIGTKVIFQIDEDDARYLRTDIAPFESEEATRLRTVPPKVHEALYHSPLSGTHLIKTFPIPPPKESSRKDILGNMRNLRKAPSSHAPAKSVASEEDDPDTKQPPSETL